MTIHVLPGDSLVEEFKKANIDGDMIVCRECLTSGPIDAETLEEFWDRRANFILNEFGEDEIIYHENVAGQLAKLGDAGPEDEFNLWFEYELFCSVNMWFCLSLITGTGAEVYRIEPIGLDHADRWDGFAKFGADDLKAAHALRTKLSDDDVTLGASLWDAYRNREYDRLIELADGTSSLAFPFVKEVARAAAEQEVEPLETIRSIVSSGHHEFAEVFSEFKKRAGIYGYGDLQVSRLVDQVSS